VCWAVVGTCTSASRAVQLWVTSNLPEKGRRGRRRWDWAAVGVQAALPTGVCYFLMAWADVWRREFSAGS
jgi:hypothetical protein